MGTDCNLRQQIRNRSHRLKSDGKVANLWPSIRIDGHIFESMAADSNIWPQIPIFPRRLPFPQNEICGLRFHIFFFSSNALSTITTLKYLYINHGDQCFFQFEIAVTWPFEAVDEKSTSFNMAMTESHKMLITF